MIEKILNKFKNDGVVIFKNFFDESVINEINFKINKYFIKNNEVEFLRIDKLFELGIIEKILNNKLRNLIYHIIPDGILYRFHIVKTPGKQNDPWFNPNTKFGSWHIDRKVNGDKGYNFVDFYIYLSNVEIDGGGYAYFPHSKIINKADINKSKRVITGKAGTAFLARVDWPHSATVNKNQKDRIMLRISLQKNYLHNSELEEEAFKNVNSKIINLNDDFFKFLMENNRQWTKDVKNKKPIFSNEYEIIDEDKFYEKRNTLIQKLLNSFKK